MVSHAPASTEHSLDEVTQLLAQAVIHQERREYNQAVDLLERLLLLEPTHIEARSRRGWLFWQQGRLDEAIAEHREVIRLAPDFAGAWSNLSIALRAQRRHDEALAALQQAIRLDPRAPESHINLGIEWLDRGLPGQAQACQRQALALNPDLVDAWINLGLSLQGLGDLDACVTVYRKVLRQRPCDLRTLSNLQMAMQYHPNLGASDLRREAETVGRCFGPELPLPNRGVWQPDERRLRVAYLSSDFYAHPVGWLSLRALTAHDRSRFEIHCYASQSLTDDLTRELQAGVEYWHPVQHLSDAELRDLILSHGIDVLVDLTGHAAGNRLSVLGNRAAPVQLSWLGFCASTGIAASDGVLLANTQAPAGIEEWFVEPVIRLPRCHFTYRPPDAAPVVAPPPAERCGILSFGSFNNPAKLNAGVLRVWAEILHEVPNSRLLLKWRSLTDPVLAERLHRQFRIHGIDPARIELRGASPHLQMLGEYGDVDIALDPFPFCGGLTTCEALWMGVPVVSFPWRRPISRQGLAILEAVNLDDLVANTPGEYVDIARCLAQDAGRRMRLRAELRDRIQRSVLFDGTTLARALEEAYLACTLTKQCSR